MGWNGIINGAKEEIVVAIEQLSPAQELSVMAFPFSTVVWSATPVPATDANKTSAIQFVWSISATGSTCMTEALLQGLEICEASTAPDRNLMLVGDGPPEECSGETADSVLAEVTAANTTGVALSTVTLLDIPGSVDFFEALAQANGSTFINAVTPLISHLAVRPERLLV